MAEDEDDEEFAFLTAVQEVPVSEGPALQPSRPARWRKVIVAPRANQGVRDTLSTSGACAMSLLTMIMIPQTTSLIGLSALLSHGKLCGRDLQLPGQLVSALAPLKPLRALLGGLSLLRVALPILSPATSRSMSYWRRMFPVMLGYYRTKQRTSRCSAVKAARLWAEQHEHGARVVQKMLFDLQGFYLKLAQILATKTEYLPLPYTSQLSMVFDTMPPVPFREIKATVEKDLGGGMHQLFRSFEEEPIACGTVAQVHSAVTLNGKPVVVKVQKRGVARKMKADMANIRQFAEIMVQGLGMNMGFDVLSLAKEYEELVPLEFDFEQEAKHIATMHEMFSIHPEDPALGGEHSSVIIPTVHAGSTKRVLIMDRIDGIPLLLRSQPNVANDQGERLLVTLFHAFGRQIFLNGVFHTDPHPGNLLVNTSRGTLALLDFGQVKVLTEKWRKRLAHFFCLVARRDDEAVVAKCHELGMRFINSTPESIALLIYVLFDTRMDLDALNCKPTDVNGAWMANIRVEKFPQQMFMVMRVVTMLRGIQSTFHFRHLSSAAIWENYAKSALGLYMPIATLRKSLSLSDIKFSDEKPKGETVEDIAQMEWQAPAFYKSPGKSLMHSMAAIYQK